MQGYRNGYLTAQEVAGIFHVGPKTVARWAKQGKLPFMRTLGGHRRYPADRIDCAPSGWFEPVEAEPHRPVGPETRTSDRVLVVLVYEAAQTVPAPDHRRTIVEAPTRGTIRRWSSLA